MIDSIFQTFGIVVGTAILVFLCMVSLLWFLLPIILYQIRNRLDTLISEQKQTKGATQYQNTLIEKQIEDAKN